MTIKLGDVQRHRMTAFLRTVEKAHRDLGGRRQVIQKAVARWEARSKKRHWPLGPHSSSLHVPMTAIVYDSIKARSMNALFGQDRDVEVQALVDEPTGLTDSRGRPAGWDEIASAYEEYVLFEMGSQGETPIRPFTERLYEETAMTGTGIPSLIWDSRTAGQVSDAGEVSDREVFSNAVLDVPAFENLSFLSGYLDFERIPFVSLRYLLRPSEIRQRINSVGWSEDKVHEYLRAAHEAAEKSETDQMLDEAEGLDAEIRYEADERWIWETWALFPLKGATEVPLLIDHANGHPMTPFAVNPWPYAHGQRRFGRPWKYLARRNRLLGMGIPERLDALDDALSTVVNQIIDGGTISNVPVWSADESVRGVRAASDIYTGKIIFRGDNPDALLPLKMGSLSPDIFEGYNILRDLIERVSKVTDYSLGRESSTLGRQGTATATLALLAETGQYFDAVVRGGRDAINDMLGLHRDLLAQQKPLERMRLIVGEEKAKLLLAAFQLPASDLRKRLGIQVSFSSTAASQELARQEEMAKFQLMQTYYEGLSLLADELFVKPWKEPLITAIAVDADRRVRKLLETFGDSSTARTLPTWNDFKDAFLQAAQERENQENIIRMLSKAAGEEDGETTPTVEPAPAPEPSPSVPF